MTKFRMWLAVKIIGKPDFHCKDEAGRLYDKLWPKHIATKKETLRTLSLFIMRQRINERLDLCRRKRYRTW